LDVNSGHSRSHWQKKTVNSSTYFGALFDVEEPEQEELEDGCFTEEVEHKLEDLENEQL